MANIATINAYDGAATPVTHSLVPTAVTREGNRVVADWRGLVSGVPVSAQARLQLTMDRLKSGIFRNEMRLTVPVMEAVAGQNAAGYTAAPKIAFEDMVIMTQYSHDRSTVESRRLARWWLINILVNQTASTAYSTSGFAADAYESLLAPT